MDLENMLSEANQAQTDNIWFHLEKLSGVGKFLKSESRLEVTTDWGEEGLLFNESQVSVGDDEVLQIDSGNSYTWTLWWLRW